MSIGDGCMLSAGVLQLVSQPVVDDRQAAVEAIDVVFHGQSSWKSEIGHFQIGSLSSSSTIFAGMGSSKAFMNEFHCSSSR